MVDVVMHRKREMGVEAVDGTAGGVGQVRRLSMAAGFQDVQKADQIALHVGAGIRQRIAHAGLSREMNHPVKGADGKQGIHCRFIGQITLDEGKGGVGAKPLEARMLEGHIVIVVEVVKAGDRVAALKQGGGHVVADKAGGAGDEYVHVRATPVFRRGPAGPAGGRRRGWRCGLVTYAPTGLAGSKKVRRLLRGCRAPRQPTQQWC